MIFEQLTITQLLLGLGAAFILGLSKSGIKGIGILIVALMALAFGAKPSTGLLLPMLLVGDVFAVIYYNRHAHRKYLLKLLPWMMLGVVIGTLVGKDLDEVIFKQSMAVVIMVSVVIMVWWDLRQSKVVPNHWSFSGFMGLSAGITTMIGNLAGAFSNLFFLAMRVPKNVFIGTTAWLFLIINLFKVPFHVFSWKTITVETLTINLILVPGILLGLFTGVRFVKRINEQFFRRFILVMTALGAILIYFR